MSVLAKDQFERTINVLSCDELAEWLEECGIPKEACQVCKVDEIDGKAFMRLTETDCKELLPGKNRWIKKILQLQSEVLASEYENAFKSYSLPRFSQQEEDNREFQMRKQYSEKSSRDRLRTS
ncbi:uncharacterized protein [Dysidea avara]|uniref:uncharacterized protein n=1 Tax=Dysidea avara TaxID=196820 RepID=UPI003330018A